MRFSEKYTSLVGALLEARLKYGAVLKQKSNPHFGGKYADLAAVMEAVDDALATVGIYPMQAVVKIEGEPLQLETRLMHTSGEYVVSHYPLSIKDGNPQAVGSAVTYARRYSLMALLGIAPEDDDAESASGRGQAQARQEQKRKPEAPTQGRQQDTQKQEAPRPTQAKPAPRAPEPPATDAPKSPATDAPKSPLMARAEALAARLPGKADALEVYARAKEPRVAQAKAGKAFAALMSVLPESARPDLLAALEKRTAQVEANGNDWLAPINALTENHDRAWGSACIQLGIDPDIEFERLPVAAAAGLALYLMGL